MTISYDVPFQQGGLALKLNEIAGTDVLQLPVCQNCHAVQYPPREICHNCLGGDIAWQSVTPGGELLACTSIRVSLESHFNENAPCLVGLIRLDQGATLLVHLSKEMKPGANITVQCNLDDFGMGVLVATPI